MGTPNRTAKPRYLKQPGDEIGQYRITGQLGRGDEADVYRVIDQRNGAVRSLKLLRGRAAVTHEEAKRAAAYYQRLAHCRHVKRYRHMGVLPAQRGVGDRPYLVFDYIEGQTIERHLTRTSRLPPGTLIKMVCHALVSVQRTGLAIGDFDGGRNILIERRTQRIVFCDLDWSLPGQPIGDQHEDLAELHKLAGRIYRAHSAKPPAFLRRLLQESDTVQTASNALKSLIL
jgi:serine/threonine protein kinase